jgi:hypothetical protein
MTVTQENLFDFFLEMSYSLERDGYHILDDLRFDFPGIPTYDEVMEAKEVEDQLIDLTRESD